MHSLSHNATCYKYNSSKSKICRFDFPRPKSVGSHIDHNRTIQLRRDNLWVNSWNPVIASLIRSNHNINFIPSSIKALALIHYITNYATKGDCSQHQRVMAAAMVRKAFDDHENQLGDGPGMYTPSLDKFALKAFNRLSHDREVSGSLVASFLLDLPDHYTPKTSLKSINLSTLRAKFPLFLEGSDFSCTDDIVRVDGSKAKPYSMLEYYMHRGPAFRHICLYEYYRIVVVIKRHQKRDSDYKFDNTHQAKKWFVQHHHQNKDQLALVALRGKLSDNEDVIA